MKNLIAFMLIIASAATGLSQQRQGGNAALSISSSAAKTKTTADNSSQVDALMTRWSQGDTPGAAVMVIQNGKVVHEKGYGLANLKTKERISSKTIFDIGSVAKPFTAMAVMMLVERGKLSYTDTLAKFFPEFQSELQPITVRQLLHHTSGLRDYTLVWNSPRTAEEVVKFLAQKSLRFSPGQRWGYSNSNYVLLAQIVSIVAGESFPQFVQKNILQPLGMNDSFVNYPNRATRAGRATGYVSQDAGAKPADLTDFVYGGGLLNTNIADMAKWDQALDTEKLVQSATLKEAFAPGRLNDGTPISYGFGWQLGRYRGLNFVGHGGETDGFIAQIKRFTEQHLTVILLSNSEKFSSPATMADKIAGIYLAEQLKLPAALQLAPERLNDYVGKYALYDLVLKVSFEEGALWLAVPGQQRVKLVPFAEDEFSVEGSKGEVNFGFNRNAQGRVTCLTLLDQGTPLCKQ